VPAEVFGQLRRDEPGRAHLLAQVLLDRPVLLAPRVALEQSRAQRAGGIAVALLGVGEAEVHDGS
jgi:hypothetical protein